MKVTLGYVSLPLTINLTASKTISYTNFKKDNDINKLYKIINENLDNLYEILKYNNKNGIKFYRMTSKLIPLGTLKEVSFDYITPFIKKYKKIGEYANKNNIRIDMHPDEYCVLNSTNPKVLENSFEILNYHKKLIDAFGFNDSCLILHVGSSVFGKENSLVRFKNNFNKLDYDIKKLIVIENDDKVYNVSDVLKLCKELNIRMCLDYHHYICNNNDNLSNYLTEIFDTWRDYYYPPKVHFSSPKSKLKKEFRSHNDYINSEDFINFLELVKNYTDNLYIMLEAKKKDEALFKLVRELKYITEYKFLSETSFEINLLH
ncbi:MAG: UV DNA damage repair endonuclease UvsE [bacterium]|nr:UV DNA damage repair endonuclease UvsE [bacterium]